MFTWRQVREGTLAAERAPEFVLVRAISASPVRHQQEPEPPPARGVGQIEIELADGSQVRVDAGPDVAAPGNCGVARMIAPPLGARVWLAARATDMRRGFDGLARQVQHVLGQIRSEAICSCSVAVATT